MAVKKQLVDFKDLPVFYAGSFLMLLSKKTNFVTVQITSAAKIHL
jgi:hypothetical protein